MMTVPADPARRCWPSALRPSTKSTVVADQHFWALLDQGCVSGGNFLTTILLARTLKPAEYGIYVLLYGLVLTMNNVHSALIWYGMSLEAAICNETELSDLVGGSLAITAWLGLALGAALVVVAMLLCSKLAAVLILLAMLLGQFQETTRRALMARLRYQEAIYGDAVSYLGQAACIAYLLSRHYSGLAGAFAVIAVSSGGAAILQALQLRLRLCNLKRRSHLVSSLWKVGRWALVANLVHNAGSQALLWLLALFGTYKVASFQATMNVLNATNPIVYSVGNVVLPTLAGCGQTRDAFTETLRHAIRGAIFIGPFVLLVIVAPRLMLQCLYGINSSYVTLVRELRILTIASPMAYIAYVLGSYYYGLSRGSVVFRANCAAAAAIGVVGWSLCSRGGTLGAVEAYDLGIAARMVVLLWGLRDGRSGNNRGVGE